MCWKIKLSCTCILYLVRIGERPASETGSTDDGLLGSSKNRHNPVMVYNDLMIRNTTVHDYNTICGTSVNISYIYCLITLVT